MTEDIMKSILKFTLQNMAFTLFKVILLNLITVDHGGQ